MKKLAICTIALMLTASISVFAEGSDSVMAYACCKKPTQEKGICTFILIPATSGGIGTDTGCPAGQSLALPRQCSQNGSKKGPC